MGCHTWFGKKIKPQPTWDEVKQYAISQFKAEIHLNNQMIDRALSTRLLEAYPEWTPEYGAYCRAINERKLQVVKKDLCKVAVCNMYYHNCLTHFINGIFYEFPRDFLHDVFRVGNYPDDQLFSMEDTINFCKIKNIPLDEIQLETLQQFWEKYPDGNIHFG